MLIFLNIIFILVVLLMLSFGIFSFWYVYQDFIKYRYWDWKAQRAEKKRWADIQKYIKNLKEK
jgi:hypothetical protein